MINHFKAEFYKLRHSKILITILGVCAAVIMVSFALGDMTFFWSWRWNRKCNRISS